MITCLVALPDSVAPELEFSYAGLREIQIDPVYPAPAHILSTEFTPAVVDSFVQDSTAYVSGDFWPSETVRIIGETRICGQRLLKVQLFPARYRASDSTLATVSSINVSVLFDSAQAVWNSTGLGAFQRLIDDSPIVGYHPVEQSTAPVPTYFGQVDPENGPPRMPDYVIICASGLYTQCNDAIDDLAEHRVSLNNFDVALVTTDDIMDDFASGSPCLTATVIRNFTEHMWEDWTQTSGKKPSYLLLIGDHEDVSFRNEPWFLPTHEYDGLYPADSPPMQFEIGNDEWYAYFNGDRSINNDFPDMMVGRLSVKNGGALQPDTLSVLIYNLIDLEDPIQQVPPVNYRRRILRLAGTGDNQPDTFIQTYGTLNTPGKLWTADFSTWMGYDYTTWYCGDGRDFTYDELSLMKSSEWVRHCLTELGRGAGVAFYTDHGSTHLFSAGLEWWPRFIEDDPYTKGARDSTFNNYQIEQNLTASQYHSAPFMLLLCCSSGNYNHTQAEHDEPVCWSELCFYEGLVTPPAHYDFGTDCIAEKLLKHTDVPVAGVFCGSQASSMRSYLYYGKGILEAIYSRGHGRLGDAIESARLQYNYHFQNFSGAYIPEMGQFNLLGDPALDISDRVRYPNSCDLSVYSGEVTASLYPVETSTGIEFPVSFRVRNNGAQNSDECDIRLIFRNGSNSNTVYFECGPIDSGSFVDYEYTWDCPAWFDPPMDLTISVEADYLEECTDCWRLNNTGSLTAGYNDTYPVLNGWMIEVDETVSTHPVLANIDNDAELEIIALTGNSLTAFEHNGTKIWEITDESFMGNQQILASDLNQDGTSNFLVASYNGIKVIDDDGVVMQTIQITTSQFAVGEMESTQGIELCAAVHNTLYLYSWNTLTESFNLNATKQLSFTPERSGHSISCADLNSNSYADAVYCCGYISLVSPIITYNDLVVYDWENGGTLYSKTWATSCRALYPAVGALGEDDLVGYPFGSYKHGNDDPAIIIELSGTLETECAQGTCDADNLRYGVFCRLDCNTRSRHICTSIRDAVSGVGQ